MSKAGTYRQDHAAVRQRAYDAVMAALSIDYPNIKLTEIDGTARAQANSWINPTTPPTTKIVPGWDWKKLWRKFSDKACRVDLAVWDNDVLYGLAIGRVSRRRIMATIHYLQRSPIASQSGISLGRVATAYLVAMAQELGCKEVAIDQPLKELLGYYKSLGFIKEVTKGTRVIRLIYPINTIMIDNQD